MPMAMRMTPRMRVIQTIVLPFYPNEGRCGKRQGRVSGSKVLGTDRRFMRRGGATKDAEAEK
jgi:hypothetical protein